MLKIEDIVNTIICGDCIEAMRDIPDNSIDLVLTDPPYNISQEKKILRDSRSGKNMDINLDFGKWDYNFKAKSFLKEVQRLLKPGGQIFIFTSDRLYPEIAIEMRKNWNYKNTIYWIKTNPLPQFRIINYRSGVEMICWAINKRLEKCNYVFNYKEKSEEKRQQELLNYWEYPLCGGNERTKHPTQKPLNLIRKIIFRHSNQNDLILDPFLGSGTTAVACKELGRKYIGIEISPDYCEIARRRLSQGVFEDLM